MKEMRGRDGSRAGARHALWAGIVVALLFVAGVGSPPCEAADPPASVPASGLQAGEVTGTGPQGVQINQQTYQVRPDAVIQTDEGKPRKAGDLRPGDHVQYRLKGGKIDRLIILMRK